MGSASQSTGLMVIHLVDSFTSGPPRDVSLAVSAEGVLQRPLRKSDGICVWASVLKQPYRISIVSQYYLPVTIEVAAEAVDAQHPQVIPVPLSPSPAYPFPATASLIRAQLVDAQGRVASNVALSAVVFSENWARCKVSKSIELNSDEIEVSRSSGQIHIGDRYLLRGGEREEAVVIAGVDLVNKKLRLATPLQHEYPRGSSLFPHIQTTSDARGEVVVAFRTCRTKTFDVQLQIGAGEHIKEVVGATEGETLNLRKIELPQSVTKGTRT